MTPQELTALARRIFPKLPHPTRPDEPWWTPGQDCIAAVFDLIDEGARCIHCGYFALGPVSNLNRQHKTIPPDLNDWRVFGELLMVTKADLLGQALDTGEWQAWVNYGPKDQEYHAAADDPRHALALAVDKMLEGDKP